jgi:Ni/Co efflux regulator RcnB
MKKLLTATLALATLGIVCAGSATTANAKPQIRIQLGQRHRDRDRNYRDRDYRDYRDTQNVIQTRIVRDGWRTYRETYQLRYLPDGRVQTVLIARERVN